MSLDAVPILLFNDECAVCRRIGAWVKRSATHDPAAPTLDVRPIGDDPDEIRTLDPELDIWDAYAVVHVVMPDGSMKQGGLAVAEVLRRLPGCSWFAWIFDAQIFGRRPGQALLDLGYAILADLRPLLGCESCGAPRPWMRFMRRWLSRAPAPGAGRTRASLRGARAPG